MDRQAPESDPEPIDDGTEQLFHQCRSLPEAERDAWLRVHCEDAAQRQDVLDLIRHSEQPGDSFIDRPVVERLVAGRRIGGFELRQLLGVGGMGVVYEAEQIAPRRTVALKVMRHGLVTTQTVRRFEYEAEVLARLRHPGVAQIYEAGVHEERSSQGVLRLPWFALEHVPGARSLTEFCEPNVALNARLELMIRVCDAVHHAHQRQVIHRDLKPSNILVDRSGQPKVIDFGIAKSTDPNSTGGTETGQVLGTIRYMSPEQLSGGDEIVDARTDVYSLGVVLYELLCGRLPYDISTTSFIDACRIVREQRPLSPRSLTPAVRGDLETILLKALEKDPAQRYAGAQDLAADLRAFLAHEPIRARPPRVSDLLRSVVRRHRIASLGIASGIVAAVLGGVLAVAGLLHARESEEHAIEEKNTADRLRGEEKRLRTLAETKVEEAAAAQRVADRELAHANASMHFLQRVLDGLTRQLENPTLPLVGVLDRLAEDLERQSDPSGEALDAVRLRLGCAYAHVGLHAKAEPLLSLALPELERSLGSGHLSILQGRANLAAARLARRPAPSAGEAREQLAELQRVADALTVDELAVDNGRALQTLSRCLTVLSDHAEASGELERSNSLRRRLIECIVQLGGEHSEAHFTTLQASYMTWWSAGRKEEAAQTLEELRVIAEALRPTAPEYYCLFRLSSSFDLFEIGQTEGNTSPAWPTLEREYADIWNELDRIVGPESLLTFRAQVYLISALIRQSKQSEATPHLKSLFRAFERGLSITDRQTTDVILINGCTSLCVVEEFAEALRYANLAEHRFARSATNPSYLPLVIGLRGRALVGLRRFEEAEVALVEALDTLPASAQDWRPTILVDYARCLGNLDALSEAEEALVQALEEGAQFESPNSPGRRQRVGDAIQLYRAWDMMDAAEELAARERRLRGQTR